MTEKLGQGHYRVKEFQSGENEIRVGVVKGKSANKDESGMFRNQYGFKSSKWYVYTLRITEIVPDPGLGGATAPKEARKRVFTDLGFVNEEFDTKKSAKSEASSINHHIR